MVLEEFEPIFGEPKTEWSAPNPDRLLPFLFHVHALDPSRLEIQVTDFDSNTWVAARSVTELEDMRDNIGIGGPWSDFVDYITASIKSENVKLVFEGQSKTDGPAHAKLVAQKSKGLPLIAVTLHKLVGAYAIEVMRNISVELYKAFKTNHELLMKEQECRYQLAEIISAEQTNKQVRIWAQKKSLTVLYQHIAGLKLEGFFCTRPTMMLIRRLRLIRIYRASKYRF